MDPTDLTRRINSCNEKLEVFRQEIHKIVIGQDDIIDTLIKGLLCNGHILLEGVPGVAKTLIVVAMVQTVKDASLQRIQFTPDLLPTDITGVTIYEEKKGFYTIKGPVFTNFLVADEVNRTPPKVQSALLQAMQEREVTIGRQTLPLPKPFFVLATQNPLETKGVYPLPEAQVDRFLFKISIGYVPKKDEIRIIDQNVDIKGISEYEINRVLGVNEILEYQGLVKQIYLADEVKRYIVSLVNATRRPKDFDVKLGKYVRWGASPRATINLSLGARATALLNGRTYTTPEDVRAVAPAILRHRIILNYEGKATEVKTDDVIKEIISKVPVR
ncbi:ATPase family associated with various cellular activities (AAA) [uncultured archaeon]|nr:ATPase family associated with various cellular activities (AAA) [uncultured archaeon]